MDSIKKLQKKIRNELRVYEDTEDDEFSLDPLNSVDTTEEEFPEEEEDEEEFNKSKARIKIENETLIKGFIKNLEFEVVFRDLADKINEEVDGVIITKIKARQIFDIIRSSLGF
jgi:hypothetical protein